MVKVTHDKKVWSDKLQRLVIRRVTEDIPKSQVSKRTLGQLKRWSDAKKQKRQISKLPVPKPIKDISVRRIFEDIKYYKTDKARATIKRRGKEMQQRQKSKSAVDLDRPYYRKFWVVEKDIHEHDDAAGFKFRYIDQYRWNKIRRLLKSGRDVRLFAVFWLDIDWGSFGKEDYDGYFINDDLEVLPYFGRAGELRHDDPDTYKRMHKARAGSAKEKLILEEWQRNLDLAIFNMTEAFGDNIITMEFQGFAVSTSDIGKTRAKY